MKTLAVLAMTVLLTSCGPKQGPATPQTVSIKVETVQCGMCAKKIETALASVEGVKKAEVDIEKKIATVEFLPTSVNLETIETAITKAGYNANDKKADPKAFEDLEECCKVSTEH
ncbi:MAG TPA: heavy-metal-associated domain-containing protein [Bacteroidota bacterium]|nr:heavy-metal-associated domain-containing protein [Bacteroidota bacterium]